MPNSPLPHEDLEQVLADTRTLWAGMRGRAFFIAGGTGFFGQWLLESFSLANDALKLGMRAVVLTRDPEAFGRKAPHLMGRSDFVFLQGDLRTFAFPAGRFDYLIHSAADTAIWTKGAGADRLPDSIVAETRHLLDFASHSGVGNFLLVSSGSIYGQQPSGMPRVPESYSGAPDPLLAASAWGEGKRLTEHMCALHAAKHGYAMKVARGFAFVGPHLPMDVGYAIGNFIGDVITRRPIKVTGDGSAIRSYQYASDLATWLWTILFRGSAGRAYNVGSADAVTIGELACEVAALLGANSAPTFGAPAVTGVPVSRYVPDIARAADELQLQNRVSLAEGILKTARWAGWQEPRT